MVDVNSLVGIQTSLVDSNNYPILENTERDKRRRRNAIVLFEQIQKENCVHLRNTIQIMIGGTLRELTRNQFIAIYVVLGPNGIKKKWTKNIMWLV